MLGQERNDAVLLLCRQASVDIEVDLWRFELAAADGSSEDGQVEEDVESSDDL